MPQFSLPPDTECTLTSFTGRTQKHGPDDVPAVSFRLLLKSVSNELLDKFSATIRHVAYKAVEGQEQLPGVEPTTPILCSKDLTSWNPDTCLEGWSLLVARGISEATALQMGSCKLDDFRFTLYEGGHVDCDFRVSTADVDEEGAGMLWSRQKRRVFVGITAPEAPAPVIDGTKAAFDADHPDQTSLLDGDAEPMDATDSFVGQQAGDFGTGEEPDDAGDAEGLEMHAEPEVPKYRGRRGRKTAEVE